MRQFAIEQLSSHGELVAVQQRHAAFYVSLAERAAAGLWGPQESVWVRRLEEETDNLRAALRWGAAQEDPGLSLRLAGALAGFWWLQGRFREGRSWLDQALARPTRGAAALRARALLGAARLALAQGDRPAALTHLQECEGLAEGLRDPGLTTAVLAVRGMLAELRGAYAEAQPLLEERLALARVSEDARDAAFALVHLSRVRLAGGNLPGAEAALEEGLGAYRQIGSPRALAISLSNLAQIKLKQGDLSTAVALAEESVQCAQSAEHRRAVAAAGLIAACLGAQRGHADKAGRLLATVGTCGECARDVVSIAFQPPDAATTIANAPRHMGAPAAGPMPLPAVIDLAWACLQRGDGRDGGRRESDGVAAPRPLLSEREQAVVQLISQGLPNKQIAVALRIAERTVKGHITSAMNKLGVDNRAHAAVAALQRGLLTMSRGEESSNRAI